MKLIPRSKIGATKRLLGDSAKEQIQARQGEHYERDLYDRVYRAWKNLDRYHQMILRNFRYVYEDQWSDIVKDEMGDLVTERERIIKRGGIPLQNNHLISIPTTLSGMYVKSSAIPTCFARQKDADAKSAMMTNSLQTCWENNQMKDLMGERIETSTWAGLSPVKLEWGMQDGLEDVQVIPVNPLYFFWESKGNDTRNRDITLIGEIRDYTKEEIAALLAKNDFDREQLDHIFSTHQDKSQWDVHQQTELYNYVSFSTPPKSSWCRTYHVWTKEIRRVFRCYDPQSADEPVYKVKPGDLWRIKEENAKRMEEGLALGFAPEDVPVIEYDDKGMYESYWYYRILGPDGIVLDEGETPYEHKSHPYCFRAYHYINGQIVPFINPVIDKQRQINRALILHDMLTSSSVKGLKFIPADCVPSDMSREEFAKQALEIGGFIFYEPSDTGQVPQFITANSNSMGLPELAQVYINEINQITNISGALQGQDFKAGTPAALYAMQTENSTTTLAAFMHSFSSFEHDVATKMMALIQQYYQSGRDISVNRSNGYVDYAEYEPKLVQDIPYNISIKETAESPVARAMLHDMIMQCWQAGALNAEQAISLMPLPGKEEILQTMRQAQQQAQQTGMPQQLDEQQMQAVAQQADPQAVQQIQMALAGR